MKEINGKQVKAVKDLIKRYESITIEEIKERCFAYGIDMAKQMLTGFGTLKCPICQTVNINCEVCIYYILRKQKCSYESTFIEIDIAVIPKELLQAYKNRANFLRQLLTDNNLM